VAWSGDVTGSVSRAYNTDFRVTETRVNGANPIAYTYDNDGLLTGAGSLTLARDTTNGLLTASSIGSVTDSRGYNSYGELEGYTASVSSSAILVTTFSRDLPGRIAQKTETIAGQTSTFGYEYDDAGRLWRVTKIGPDGIPLVTAYEYDLNGNRLSKTEPGGDLTSEIGIGARTNTFDGCGGTISQDSTLLCHACRGSSSKEPSTMCTTASRAASPSSRKATRPSASSSSCAASVGGTASPSSRGA